MSEVKWTPTTTGGAIVKDGSPAWFIVGADGAQEIADYLNNLEAECARQAGLLEDGTKGMAILAKEIADLRGLEVTVARYKAALLTIAGSVEQAQWDAWDCAGFAAQALEPTAEKA